MHGLAADLKNKSKMICTAKHRTTQTGTLESLNILFYLI